MKRLISLADASAFEDEFREAVIDLSQEKLDKLFRRRAQAEEAFRDKQVRSVSYWSAGSLNASHHVYGNLAEAPDDLSLEKSHPVWVELSPKGVRWSGLLKEDGSFWTTIEISWDELEGLRESDH